MVWTSQGGDITWLLISLLVVQNLRLSGARWECGFRKTPVVFTALILSNKTVEKSGLDLENIESLIS